MLSSGVPAFIIATVMKRFAFVILLSIMSVPSQGVVVLRTTYQLAPPKYYVGEDRKVKGLCVDIIKRLNTELKRYGILIKSDGKFRTAGEIFRLLREGKIDLFVGFAKTKRRKEQLIYSDYPVYSVFHGFLVRTLGRKAFILRRDLISQDVAVPKGTRSYSVFLKSYGVKPKGVTSIYDGIRLFKEGKVKAVFYSSLSLYYYKQLLGSEYKVVRSGLGKYYHYVVFSRGLDDKIIRTVNEAVKSILLGGDIEKIIFSNPVYAGSVPANVMVFANIDWPPYEWFEGGFWRGMDVEILKRVFSEIGIKVQILKLPWVRILRYLKLGIIDGTFTISKTKSRQAFLWYSDEPLTTGIYGFFTLKTTVEN